MRLDSTVAMVSPKSISWVFFCGAINPVEMIMHESPTELSKRAKILAVLWVRISLSIPEPIFRAHVVRLLHVCAVKLVELDWKHRWMSAHRVHVRLVAKLSRSRLLPHDAIADNLLRWVTRIGTTQAVPSADDVLRLAVVEIVLWRCVHLEHAVRVHVQHVFRASRNNLVRARHLVFVLKEAFPKPFLIRMQAHTGSPILIEQRVELRRLVNRMGDGDALKSRQMAADAFQRVNQPIKILGVSDD